MPWQEQCHLRLACWPNWASLPLGCFDYCYHFNSCMTQLNYVYPTIAWWANSRVLITSILVGISCEGSLNDACRSLWKRICKEHDHLSYSKHYCITHISSYKHHSLHWTFLWQCFFLFTARTNHVASCARAMSRPLIDQKPTNSNNYLSNDVQNYVYLGAFSIYKLSWSFKASSDWSLKISRHRASQLAAMAPRGRSQKKGSSMGFHMACAT